MKKRVRSKKRELVKLTLLVLVIVVAVGVVWANFFYYKSCENMTCFNDYLKDCKRARVVNSGEMVFEYKILGNQGEDCVVDVKLIRGDLSVQDSLKLENKEMKCYIPSGLVILPESDIDNCHGLLKEGLQDLVIEKMHQYIVKNLGKINLDLFSAAG